MPAREELPSTLQRSPKKTAGGVDENATKKHLMELAQRLDVKGRSTMTKDELVDALQKANARSSRQALGN